MFRFIFLLPLFFSSILSYSISASPLLYQVDLDLPPSLRYKTILVKHKEPLIKLYNTILETYVVSQLVPEIVTWYAERFYRNEELLGEFKAVAEQTGISLGGVFLMNHLYEIFAFCTSIVSQNSSGYIIHGRNLDYPFKNMLGELSIKIEYMKNGKVLFEADTIAGFSGVLTGHKKGVFGVSINERHSGTIESILATIYNILFKSNFIFFLFFGY
jgi:beta subunit of N-acylethanolamine-hydrolyzing acid amidase/Linear amide C-N hydrolases, choloylglycine hydrolase family